ncbi:TetR/AcrR family transcriptional regulator [Fluviispira vulneris]|uniref:TetR/AcrR family transcriptional regulator n=1 Tax=Fluviispira vulneris TaxID=2763012 RepID=UPI001645037E|nr:TetR/AcrR family transcriptional regulator [Fluviispira vulneris]
MNNKYSTKYSIERFNKKNARMLTILKVATDLFAQKGYELSTTKEISIHAKCSEGLIFKYFKNKTNLLSTLLEKGLSRVINKTPPHFQNQVNLENILSSYMRWTLDGFWEERKVFKIYYAQLLQGNINLSTYQKFEEFFKYRNRILIKLLQTNLNNQIFQVSDFENIFLAINSCALNLCIFNSFDSTLPQENIFKKGQDFIKILIK